MPGDEINEGGLQRREWFGTTSWTNLLKARQGDSPEAQEALSQLCNAYWYPLYAYVRRKGYSAQDAEDLTQAFFFQVIEKNYLGAVDRRKGKFRSFLLAALNHFLSNERDYRNAEKRGGGKVILSLEEQAAEDRYQLEPATDESESPESIYEQRWAKTVLEQARSELEGEYERSGKSALFQQLKPFLSEGAGSGDYAPVAETLKMSPGAVAVAVHRLRQRFSELVRAEVQRTVARPEEIEGELRHLCDILQVSSL